MRDGTKVAGAFLRSEMYRDSHRDVEARPARPARVPARTGGRSAAETRWQRVRSGASSPLTALALLGLLDVLNRG
jgi:hypothetical protein